MGTFAPPTIPWLVAQPLALDGLDLGPGLEGVDLVVALQRLCALPELQALVIFGSRGPRFQESCHPFDQHTRGLEDMSNAPLQRGC